MLAVTERCRERADTHKLTRTSCLMTLSATGLTSAGPADVRANLNRIANYAHGSVFSQPALAQGDSFTQTGVHALEVLTGLGMQLTHENACALVHASDHTGAALWLHTRRVTRRNTSVGTNLNRPRVRF